MNRLRKEVADIKITIAILVLLLATITAMVFTVKDSPPEKPTSETQITFSTTEKETATEIISVTESETYKIETEAVAPTTERKAETETQKPTTTKPKTTTTQRAIVPSTTQVPVSTTKPVTTTAPTTTQPTTVAAIDIDYYINYSINYGKSIGLTYIEEARDCWDTPIGVRSTNHDAVVRDIKDRLNDYRYLDGDEYFCVLAEKRSNDRYELFIGYA